MTDAQALRTAQDRLSKLQDVTDWDSATQADLDLLDAALDAAGITEDDTLHASRQDLIRLLEDACGDFAASLTPRPVNDDADDTDAADAQVAVFVAMVQAIGPGYHPDTVGARYTALPTGYTADDVDRINADTDAALRSVGDVDLYEIALTVQH